MGWFDTTEILKLPSASTSPVTTQGFKQVVKSILLLDNEVVE
jgi:hypothetical protein